MANKVETKVKAGSVAAGATSAVLWVLGTYVFHGSVPDVLAVIVEALVPALVALAAGYRAKHTPRPGDAQ